MTATRVTRTLWGLLGVFLAILVVEHALRSELSPRDHRLSEYATGSSGWLMTLGFGVWALALAAGAYVVTRSSLEPVRLRLMLGALLATAVVGVALSAAFETGTRAGAIPAGAQLSVENHLHDLGSGLAGLALWIAAILSLGLRDSQLRRNIAMLVSVAVLAAVLLSDALLDFPGFRQRFLLVVACAWLGLIAATAARDR